MASSLLSPVTLDAAPGSPLLRKIGWLCHAIRILAAIWVLWAGVLLVQQWADRAHVADLYGRFFHADLGAMSQVQYLGAAGLVFVDWAVAALMVAALWRLFRAYLAGHVFTVDAAVWLRRVGSLGLLATAIDILTRPLVALIFLGHLDTGHWGAFFLAPRDMLHVIFAVFVLSLAHIFKAAAELADDHAQIV